MKDFLLHIKFWVNGFVFLLLQRCCSTVFDLHGFRWEVCSTWIGFPFIQCIIFLWLLSMYFFKFCFQQCNMMWLSSCHWDLHYLGFTVIPCVLCAQLHPTLCDPMNCSLPGSSVHRISQARIPEWVAISYSRGSSQLKDWIRILCTGRWILYHWVAGEALYACRRWVFIFLFVWWISRINSFCSYY